MSAPHPVPPAGNDSRWPLPQGVSDLFLEDALEKRDLEEKLRGLFRGWAYGELIPPSFEYADSLASEGGTQLAEEMVRFVDRDGRTLALRPDMTIPAARVVGTRLYDQPMPLRLFYIGSVFRHEAPQAGRQREFTQAGVELIGAAGAGADAEVLALAIEALEAAGVQGYQVVLGQMAFFRGLLAELRQALRPAEGAGAQLNAAVQQAVDRKSPADLAAILAPLALPEPLRQALLALPNLSGSASVLKAGRRHCLNPAMEEALDRLDDIRSQLSAYGVAERVSFDLGETRGMEYYTGITFKGYAPGLGYAVCSGGRYDDLVGHFGPPQPAVGCALWLDRLQLVRQRQGRRPAPRPPDLLLAAGTCPQCLKLAVTLRRRGLVVELDLTGRPDAELERHANARAIPRVVVCRSPERVVVEDPAGRRVLTAAQLEAEAAAW